MAYMEENRVQKGKIAKKIVTLRTKLFCMKRDCPSHTVSLWCRLTLCLALLCLTTVGAAKNFVVVIDAGHGGHDPGAIGKISKEKNINLKVALKLGNKIKQNCADVKVIYTRTRDVFVPLDRRAQIANDAKADLFISIHTNALPKNKTYQGPSTWTLGLAKSDENLEVAKRENSVILHESDYQTRYAGFNPNSAESYIIFEFMQDKYMQQSVHLASLVQKQFKNSCKRIDRGVHQAGFLVLKASAMPSILVELGFISTPAEEKFLNTEAGTTSLADGIYRAFVTYKKEQDARRSGAAAATPAPEQKPRQEQPEQQGSSQENKEKQEDTPEAQERPAGAVPIVGGKPLPQPKEERRRPDAAKPVDELPVFKVQILTSSTPIATNNKKFAGVKQVERVKEGKIYKYMIGATTDYNQALRTKRSVEKQFEGAFIIAFRSGVKMDVRQAIKEFKERRQKQKQ